MPNPLFLDTNTLVYAVEAGGTVLLDKYLGYANAAGLQLVVTDVVKQEILRGPKAAEIGQWLTANNVLVQSTSGLAQYVDYYEKLDAGLPTGDYTPKNAGDYSTAEAAQAAKQAGATPRVFADDKFFQNTQSLRPYGLSPDIGITSADMLNHAAAAALISPEQFTSYQTGYRQLPPWDLNGGSYSHRLDTFWTAEQLNEVLAGAPVAQTYLARLARPLAVLGVAGTLLDITTSSAEAAVAVDSGNNAGAANIMARLAARLYWGWQGAVGGAALGATAGAPGGLLAGASAIFGGLVGGIGGSLAGEAAVALIWEAAGKVTRLLSGDLPAGNEVLFPAGLSTYDTLVAAGADPEQARMLLNAMARDYQAMGQSNPALSAENYLAALKATVADNQAVAITDELGPLVRTIGNDASGWVEIFDDSGNIKAELANGEINNIAGLGQNASGEKVLDVVSGANGGITERRFDSAGRITKTLDYTSTGRLLGTTTFDADNSKAWARIELTHNAAGFITTQNDVYDDGRRTETTFDTDNTQTWSQIQSQFNPDGVLSYSATANDDGSRKTITYDAASANTWSRYEVNYNGANQMSSRVDYYDSGARTETSYDAGNLQGWGSIVKRYNTIGQLVDSTTYFDAGSRAVTTFDLPSGAAKQLDTFGADGKRTQIVSYDFNNTQTWSRYEINYNGNLQATSRVDYFDTGARNETTYDPTNTEIWTTVVKRYNSAGQLVDSTTNADNGFKSVTTFDLSTGAAKQMDTFGADGKRTQIVSYDFTNTQTWSRYEINYNGALQAASRVDYFDTGARNETTYDPENTQSWSSIVKRYVVGGQLFDSTTYVDGGSRSVTTFDLQSGAAKQTESFGADGKRTQIVTYDFAGANTWSRYEVNYNSSGQITSRSDYGDDGGRSTTTFDAATGAIKQVEHFSPAGALTNKTVHDLANAGTWARMEISYNAQGQIVAQNDVYDDATRVATTYDPANVNDWRILQQRYDNQNRLISDSTLFDSGERLTTTFSLSSGKAIYAERFGSDSKRISRTDYDFAEADSWASIEQFFDSAGGIREKRQINDDGTRAETTYDVAGDQTWSRTVRYFNAGGQAVQRVQFHDDGSYTNTAINPANGLDAATEFVNSANILARRVSVDFDNTKSWATVEKIFDTTGTRVLQQNDVYDDGTLVVTSHDVDGIQPWSESRVEYNAAGQRTYSEVILDDGAIGSTVFDVVTGAVSREYSHFADGTLASKLLLDPSNTHEWSSIKLEYNQAGNLVKQTDQFDDGAITITSHDAGNAAPWSLEQRHYNSAGTLQLEIQNRDDGTQSVSFHNLNDATGRVRAEQQYDAQGRNIMQTDFMSNGAKTVTTFDPANAQPWFSQSRSYDVNGALQIEVSTADDGSYTQSDYDTLSAHSWSTGKHSFDSAGRKVIEDIGFDSGVRLFTQFDAANTAAWSRNTQQFNSAGQVTNEIVANDDGSYSQTDYDPANAYSWSSGKHAFDSSGRKLSEDVILDSGDRYTTTFDVANAQSWSQITKKYSPSGLLTNEVITNDNGSRQQTDWDPTNQYTWSSGVHVYNSVGQKLTEDVALDDGRRILTTFDDSNVQNWRHIIQEFNSAGQKTGEVLLNDDGTRLDTIYNPMTGAIISTTRRDAAGNPIIPVTYDTGSGSSAASWFNDIFSGYNTPNPAKPSQSLQYYPPIAPPAKPTSTASKPVSTYKPATGSAGGSQLSGIEQQRQEQLAERQRLTNGPQSAVFVKLANGAVGGGYHAMRYDPATGYYRAVPPVGLDLNDDGQIQLNTMSDRAGVGPTFDWDGDGHQDQTSWVGPDDGFLVIDLASDGGEGADGMIDQARELAFAHWAKSGSDISDLEGLRLAFDTNKDNVLNEHDARWKEFRVWQDANQNGVADTGELRTLSDAGIRLINLVPSTEGYMAFSDGSRITGTTNYQRADGTTGVAADVTLAFRPQFNTFI